MQDEQQEEINVDLVINNWRKRHDNDLYKPEYCETIIKLGAQGAFQSHMAATLGICEKTLYNWQDRIPEFKEALDWARTLSKAYHEWKLIKGEKGDKNYNFAANAFILSNQWKAEYARNMKEGETVNNLTVNNLNLSSDEVKERIAEITAKLAAKGQMPSISFPFKEPKKLVIKQEQKENDESNYTD